MPFDPSSAAKYGANQVETKRAFKADPLVDWADRAVPIVDILNRLGLHVPDGANNWRTTCPFAYEHANKDKGFRVHSGNNNAYCYGWHGFLTPTKLVAHSEGISRVEAAKKLLNARGLLQQQSYKQRWVDLQTKKDKVTRLTNTPELLDELQKHVMGIPGYPHVEFNADVRSTWTRVIEALELLTEKSATEEVTVEHLDRWYTWSLELLVHTIEEESNG